mmetsp:Transcript_72176/g.215379  ORF Transcript_72176/g.215379 Transcript_72176/m.215379 type:complete len:294 (+) Transcript_72176:618-1499(+)
MEGRDHRNVRPWRQLRAQHAAALAVGPAGLRLAHHLRPGSHALKEADVHRMLRRALQEEKYCDLLASVDRHLEPPLRVLEVLPEVVAAATSRDLGPLTHGGPGDVAVRQKRGQLRQGCRHSRVRLDREVERRLVRVLRDDENEFSASLQNLAAQLHKGTLAVGVDTLFQWRIRAAEPLLPVVYVCGHVLCGDLRADSDVAAQQHPCDDAAGRRGPLEAEGKLRVEGHEVRVVRQRGAPEVRARVPAAVGLLAVQAERLRHPAEVEVAEVLDHVLPGDPEVPVVRLPARRGVVA